MLKRITFFVVLLQLAFTTGMVEGSSGPALIDMGVPAIRHAEEGIIGNSAVNEIVDTGHNVQVWQLLPENFRPGRFRLSMQHAVAGKQGSFFMIAWADKDGNGIPDTEIARSELKTAAIAGDWSSWEFTCDAGNLFVGNTWPQKNEKIYYRHGGKNLNHGLSNKLFYSRTFDTAPNKSTSPRYTNIKVEKISADARIIGVTTHEVKSALDTGHNIQVWGVKPEYTRSGKYTVSIKHGVAGAVGSFYITAWADTSGNGVPDREIGRSDLKSAAKPGEWSSWSFTADVSCRKIFVGNTWNREDERVYYQNSGDLLGYEGLESKLFFARKFNAVPNQSTQPRYTNIKVTVH
ncbi:MAG: hypothetical protein KKB51_03735 [Candidatus Riflebacteria bacterium]|nr:hypothetical protein [Candidatus Riflebacteria bacterium]